MIRKRVSVLAIALLLAFQMPTGRAEESVTSVPIYDGLGSHGRSVTTSSLDAQRYFSQGLCLLYAFNHDEAIRSFRKAAELDPNCAMAWWGVAMANGPHINNALMSPERSEAAWNALKKSRDVAGGATAVEQGLIGVLAKRYANPPPADRLPLDKAYADAMRELRKQHPDDADIGAMFAESLMDLRPWDLWTQAGKPQPGTEEIVETLEAVLAKAPHHPLALHLYIHAVEASRIPGKAESVADRLRDLQPGLGHLVHMPSHIDVRLGHWTQAIDANTKAIASDRAYRKRSRDKPDFYHVYIAHNFHMLTFAAMMRGQSRLAQTTIHDMVQEIPADWVQKNAPIADGFTAMPLEVLVRFGRWDEVLAAPEPPEHFPIARSLRHCARGIAYSAQGNTQQAQAEQESFLQAVAAVPPEAMFGNNKAADLLSVAKHLLAGEISYRQGKVDLAIGALREAVKHEDQLRYSEPPDWIHPVRHALGATLLKEGKAPEAEQVYREDLQKIPENVWSLFGLTQSLRMQGKVREADDWQARFQKASRDADVPITTSCFCQKGQ